MKARFIWALVAFAVCWSPACVAMTISAVAVGPGGCGPANAVLCPAGFGRIDVIVTDPPWLVGDVWTVTAAGPFSYCRTGENPQTFTCFPGFGGTQVFVFDNIGGTGLITFSAVSTSGAWAGPTVPIFVANLDLNASCLVSAVDLGTFASLYGTLSPSADYNCSGRVDAVDLATFGVHYGHQ